MRILIADDSALIRRGVIGLLSVESEWEVCGEAADGAEAAQKGRELRPDLILMDINMPAISGLEVVRLLRHEGAQAKVIIISQNDPAQLMPSVIASGADACLDKSRLASALLPTIRNLMQRSSVA